MKVNRSTESAQPGATAMRFHGLVRATEELDLFIRGTAENVERLRVALRGSYANDPHIEEISAGDAWMLAFSYSMTRAPQPCFFSFVSAD